MSTIPSASAVDQALWTSRESTPLVNSGIPTSTASVSKAQAAQTGAGKAKDVGQQFEAVYLRQMMDESMPKDSEALFGEGTAGSVWRSMLADSLATALSKTGTIGIAQMIMKQVPDGSKGK